VTRIVALVPMRHESERVPGKNYRPFHRKPLYRHIVEILLASDRVDEVVIDTDSPTITEDAAQLERVRVIPRPEHLLGGAVPMNDVLLHDVSQVEADWYLQTHSTNPLMRSETVRNAVDRFLESQPTHDSLFSVTPLQTRLYWPDGRAVNHDPRVLLRTQDLPPVYEENSCLYLFSRETLERHGTRIGERPLLYEMDPKEAVDIDEELDFLIAEALYDIQRAANA
jgi:CMP-N-acetylneuraminic acid synthetase